MIDYNHVEARQDGIHYRLEHWARWVSVKPQAWKVQPMFRQYRSHAWQWHIPEIKIELNTPECAETERAVSLLPDKHRTAIRWAYVFNHIPPNAVRRELAVTKDELGRLIVEGRDMLTNRLRQVIVDHG